MRSRIGLNVLILCALMLALAGSAGAQGPTTAGQGTGPQAALGTAFTYQGQLTDNGSPAEGAYDLGFRLFTAAQGGTQVGGPVTRLNVPVSAGSFAVLLDFGAGAFAGEARYLEIAVRPSGGGDYAVLSPRQLLSAAPQALYAASAPWSGLNGVPAGFADGADADALGALSCSAGQVAKWNGTAWACGSYSDGPGLTLSGGQFSVDFGGSGSSDSVARADHDHLGQTWIGSDNPLVITGTFGSLPYYAPVVLGNDIGHGLLIELAGYDGVRVTSADSNGVQVSSAGSHGVAVYSAGASGVAVTSAGANGMYVGSAGYDGVYVYSAGSPSGYTSSSYSNGFEVAGAEGNGLFVGRAGYDGVYVSRAGDDGVYVYSAGSPSTHLSSSYANGFEVAGAEGSGLHIGGAGDDGVYVYSAGSPSMRFSDSGSHGFEVAGAEGNGLFVGRADGDGVNVFLAGDDGVFVYSAGSPTTTLTSPYANGFEVAGAERDGLFVGWAGNDGVEVMDARIDGLKVADAGRYGIYVAGGGTGAGRFDGDVEINGTLSKSSGSFKIDHPLDPENKYLYHSFVESPDMMNVYNGNVVLDDNGEAWVEMPAWFEALNRDFRYQLTPVGGPGPGLYIAREVADNRFQIAGGAPGLTVSWQVTGIRRDPYAEANRIAVEQDKPPEERGTYLHPQAYGQPVERGLAYRENQARTDWEAQP